jgi:drug/metabolite transporter (DMT)-like permease
MGTDRWWNLSLLLFVNLLWAGQFPAYRIASEYMTVATLNFWTFVFAVAVLAPFFLRLHRHALSERPRMRAVADFAILGIVGVIPPSVFLSWGIARSTASNAAVISLVIPVLMALMGVAMLGERMTRLRWFSLALALIGTVGISRLSRSELSVAGSFLIANVVIFVAWLGAAFYNTFSKKLFASYAPVEILVYGYVVACVGCALLSLRESTPFYAVHGYPPKAWVAVAVLGTLSWGLSMVMWMRVLERLEVSQISVSIYLMPLFGVILSAILLKEHLTATELVGGALILVSTILASGSERKAST